MAFSNSALRCGQHPVLQATLGEQVSIDSITRSYVVVHLPRQDKR